LKIGEIIVKNISLLDEFAIYFHRFKLREIQKFHGFEPNGFFSNPLFAIGYGSSFTKSTQMDEGRWDNQNP
jgi:hypothetical protein